MPFSYVPRASIHLAVLGFCLLTFLGGCKRQDDAEPPVIDRPAPAPEPAESSLDAPAVGRTLAPEAAMTDRELLDRPEVASPAMLDETLPPSAPAAAGAPASSGADPTVGYEAWFQRYGLDLSDPEMLEADADGDGYSNRDEFLVDTDPTDATSRPGFHPVMRLSSFDEVDLPLVTQSVSGRRATILNEDTGETMTVEAGDPLPGTSYRVESVREKVESDKFGQVANVSRVTAKDPGTGEMLNLMIGMKPRSQASSAHLTSVNDPSVAVEIRQGGEFAWPGAGGTRFVVVDLRQEQAVVKQLDTGEVFTVPLERPKP